MQYCSTACHDTLRLPNTVPICGLYESPFPTRAPLVTSTADIELATTGKGLPFKDLNPKN